MTDRPVTYAEAVAVTTEIAESLGGRQKLVLETILRYAARGRRPSSMDMEAVRDASLGAQNFAAARHELLEARRTLERAEGRIEQGIVAIGEVARTIRKATEDDDEGGPP